MYALSADVNRSHENSEVPFSREIIFTGTFSFQFIILIIFSALEEKKEAIHIRRQRTALNRNGGYELAAIFSHLLSRDNTECLSLSSLPPAAHL